MMSKSRLELLGLQTLLSGLELAAHEANENVRQARGALEVMKAQAEAAENHFLEAKDVAVKRRAVALLPSPEVAPQVDRRKLNRAICREAGIENGAAAPTRKMIAKAWKIVARREGVSTGQLMALRSGAATVVPEPEPEPKPVKAAKTFSPAARRSIGKSVRARWALLKEAGIKKPASKGAPSKLEMERAKRIIAARGKKLTQEQKDHIGAMWREKRERCREAGVDTDGKLPNKAMSAKADAILKRLCRRAGISLNGEPPTIAQVKKAKLLLKRLAGQQASRPVADDVQANNTQVATEATA